MFDRAIFQRNLAKAYSHCRERNAGTLLDLEESYEIFILFFEEFERQTATEHPPLSTANLERLLLKLPFTAEGEELDETAYRDIISPYFRQSYKNCDFHITHFLAGKIRDNLIRKIF